MAAAYRYIFWYWNCQSQQDSEVDEGNACFDRVYRNTTIIPNIWRRDEVARGDPGIVFFPIDSESAYTVQCSFLAAYSAVNGWEPISPLHPRRRSLPTDSPTLEDRRSSPIRIEAMRLETHPVILPQRHTSNAKNSSFSAADAGPASGSEAHK